MNDFFVLAYIGPDTMLPVASIIAACVGVVMIGWQFIKSRSMKVVRFVLRKDA